MIVVVKTVKSILRNYIETVSSVMLCETFISEDEDFSVLLEALQGTLYCLHTKMGNTVVPKLYHY